MNKTALGVLALIGAALVVWWATTDSLIALGLLLALVVIASVYVVKTTGASRVRTQHDVDEGKARAGFPRPPEGPRPT